MTRDRERKLVRGAFAGLVAGVVAAFAMERFQTLTKQLSSDHDDSEPSTQRAADALAEAATGAELPEIDKPLGGQAAHYLLGSALGMAYGIAAEFAPAVTLGAGTAFGASTTLVLDETLVPAAGLAEPASETPLSTHAYSLAAHVVFGGVAEIVRRQMVGTFKSE